MHLILSLPERKSRKPSQFPGGFYAIFRFIDYSEQLVEETIYF
jgi:hypothetical protein